MTELLAIADGLWPFLLGAILAWLASGLLRLRQQVRRLEKPASSGRCPAARRKEMP